MSEQRFCLRWNHHQATLINVFESLLKDESLVDVTLYAEGRPVKAHKVVLSACSQYFKTIFSAHRESHPVIIINNVLHSELRALVDYMYRGEVNVCQDQLSSFIKAAESLKIKGLADGGDRQPSVSAPSPPPPPPVPFQATPLRASSPPASPASGGGARPDQLNGRVSPPPVKRPRPASMETAPSAPAAPWEAPAARPASAEERSEAARSPGAGAGLPRIPATITPLAGGGRRPEQPPSPPAAPPLPPPEQEPPPPPVMKKEEVVAGPGGAEDGGPESDAELDGVDGDPGPSGHPVAPAAPLPPQQPAAAPPGFLNWPLGGADVTDGPFGAVTEAGAPQGWLVVPALAAARRHGRPSSGGASDFTCIQCGRQFRWKSNLSRHLRLECGVERKFQCRYCQYRFVHKHHLESHVNKRHGECALPLNSDLAQVAEVLGSE